MAPGSGPVEDDCTAPASAAQPAPSEDSLTVARSAGLRYVSDAAPGLRRVRAGKGFTYRDAAGKRVRDAAVLARIRSLTIPPAWTDVWI